VCLLSYADADYAGAILIVFPIPGAIRSRPDVSSEIEILDFADSRTLFGTGERARVSCTADSAIRWLFLRRAVRSCACESTGERTRMIVTSSSVTQLVHSCLAYQPLMT
jgi:hypothetical protein